MRPRGFRHGIPSFFSQDIVLRSFVSYLSELGKCPRLRRRQNPCLPVLRKIRNILIFAAYAFTDYRSQGQTLPYVIIDIASPPTGTLSLFNLFVTLLKGRGRASIRLLRDFDEKLFMASHDPALIDEDERLEKLNITNG